MNANQNNKSASKRSPKGQAQEEKENMSSSSANRNMGAAIRTGSSLHHSDKKSPSSSSSSSTKGTTTGDEIAHPPPTKKAKMSPGIVVLLDDDDDDDDNKDHDNVKPNFDSNTSLGLDDPRDPTKVTSPGDYWIFQQGPLEYRQEGESSGILGKWLIFRPTETVTDTWKRLAQAVQSGYLQAASSKVSTQYNNTVNENAPKKGIYVICIFTSAERMLTVGHLLIALVQHDIRYKTDAMTRAGNYYTATTKVSHMTLYWNGGKVATTL
ncbi:hypothetical protein ACA910_005777 [Epithemia clementina (nom. ined.)]